MHTHVQCYLFNLRCAGFLSLETQQKHLGPMIEQHKHICAHMCIYIYILMHSFATLLLLTSLRALADDNSTCTCMVCHAGKWSRMPSRPLKSRQLARSHPAVAITGARRQRETLPRVPRRTHLHARTSVEVSLVESPQRGSRANRPQHLRRLRNWQRQLQRSQSAAPAKPERPHRDQIQGVLYQ